MSIQAKILKLVGLLFISTAGWAQIPLFEVSSGEAIAKAKQNSERLKSSISDWLAAQEQADAAFALLLPKLSLDGSFTYLTVVPAIQVPVPGIAAIPTGANVNYNVGPTLSYNLWDSGVARNAYKGQLRLSESREEEQKNTTAQLVGAVKSTYAKVQLGLEQLSLVGDSLSLARAQDQDVSNRFSAGSANRLDLLTAHREVLNYELQFKQQQSELAGSFRDLLALLQDQTVENPSRPAPEGVKGATVWLKLDTLEKTLSLEMTNEPTAPDENSPQIKSQEYLAESLELLSRSQRAVAYPQLQISARTSLNYPNGPILQNINQNTFSANLTMPLWEFGRNSHLAAQKEKEAESARHRKNQLQSDVRRDFSKAKEQLVSLREQQKNAEESAEQSETLARLYYESYRYGRINLVDVQGANVRALQAKVALARIRAQILNQIIVLKTLSGKES